MTDTKLPGDVPRRSFVARLAAVAGAFGLGGVSTAHAQPSPPQRWQPARHAEDDWFDTLPGKHRFFLDAVSPLGAGEAMRFATNFLTANNNGYHLPDGDLAVVICLRHRATPVAFSDAIWAKYGGPIAEQMKFEDPTTGTAPTRNVYTSKDYGAALPNRGVTLGALTTRGVHYAVCGIATRSYASTIAKHTGGDADAVFKELVAGLMPNSHVVAAGIVAVSRAQERGYTFSYVG